KNARECYISRQDAGSEGGPQQNEPEPSPSATTGELAESIHRAVSQVAGSRFAGVTRSPAGGGLARAADQTQRPCGCAARVSSLLSPGGHRRVVKVGGGRECVPSQSESRPLVSFVPHTVHTE